MNTDFLLSRNISSSTQNINSLFDDMTYLQENLFSTLPGETYLRIFAYSILTAGRADYIEKYASYALCCSAARKTSSNHCNTPTLTFNESVAIIVEAAQYYFNIATSFEDPNMGLANVCLSLITFHPDLERERKLIDALRILNDFGVHISPLKVRMCVDSKKMIEKVLKVEPKGYKNIDKLISLAINLQNDDNVNRNEVEVDILNAAVDAAIKLKDYSWCSSVMLKLLDDGKLCWNLCKKLCQSEDYNDLETKQKLIKYALMQCPEKELIFLIEMRNKIECQSLQRKLKKSLGQQQKPETFSEPSVSPESVPESYQGLIPVPALMNMLHTSSSHVLNVDFWKNTFSLNLEGNVNTTMQNMNAECEKLAFSEFYADVQDGKDCIFSRGLNQETEIFQQLLRYYMLRSKDAGVENVTEDIEDVIVQFSIASFSNDCLLCLSLLSLLKDTNCSEKVFSSLPATAIVEKFALYYYSLKFLVNSGITVHDLVTKEPPATLVSRALSEAKNVDSDIVSLMKKYSKALDKRRGVDKLDDLGCGIDSTRFFADETYKLDSILGLAMYEEREKLDLALSLGAEYNVSSEDIMLSHIKTLFLSGNVTQLTSRLKEPIVVETLKRNPSDAAGKLISNVYDGLHGCDYPILLIFYALLNQIDEDHKSNYMRPKEHMKLLRKLKTFTKEIDYKLLTAENVQILEAVMPAVFIADLNNIINFLTSLPSIIQEQIDFKDVFEQMSLKIFFNAPADLSYEKRFRKLFPLLKRIEKDRIKFIVQKFLFSKYSCENIDTDVKREILNVAIKNLSQEYAESDSDLIRSLKDFSQRLVKIDEFNEICKAVDINEAYLRDLEEAVLQDGKIDIKDTIFKMVLDLSVSADVINVILEFARAGSLPDFITDLLSSDISEDTLEPLLRRIENCLEDNEYEKGWGDQLNSRLQNDSTANVHRAYIENIVSVLCENDDDVYDSIERLHETRLILREWIAVHSRISLFDVMSDESRLALLEKLVRQASCLSHFLSLVRLLKFWPRFVNSSDWSKNPWLLLAEKVLALKEDEVPGPEVLNLFQDIISHASLNKEVKRAFFEHIASAPHNKVLIVWFCILSDDKLLVESVSNYLKDLIQEKKLPSKIENQLRRKYHDVIF